MRRIGEERGEGEGKKEGGGEVGGVTELSEGEGREDNGGSWRCTRVRVPPDVMRMHKGGR